MERMSRNGGNKKEEKICGCKNHNNVHDLQQVVKLNKQHEPQASHLLKGWKDSLGMKGISTCLVYLLKKKKCGCKNDSNVHHLQQVVKLDKQHETACISVVGRMESLSRKGGNKMHLARISIDKKKKHVVVKITVMCMTSNKM